MSFPREIIQGAVSIANALTVGVQSPVIHEAWISQSFDGTRTYAAPVYLSAVVDFAMRQVTDINGEKQTALATLTFIGDVPPNGAPNRVEPFDPRDRMTIPGHIIGPIISTPNSVIDPETSRGFVQIVYLGAR